MLFFKIKQIDDLNYIESFNDFTLSKNKIENASKSFYNFPIDHGRYDLVDFIPKQIVDEYIENGNRFYADVVDRLSDVDDYDAVCNFFQNKFKKNLIKRLQNYKINFSNKDSFVYLKYAENFRFKSEQGFQNIFNIPILERVNVLPNDKNDFIFMIDFRQFEFRTFLKIQGIDSFFGEKKIYEVIGEKLGINSDNVKTSIIAYLYGSKLQPKMEDFFKKQKLISTLKNEIIWIDDYPVFNDKSSDENKKIHTTIQTISQYKYLEKLDRILDLIKNKKSSFIFPLHDSMIFSINKNEIDLIDQIIELAEDEVYKVKSYVGKNLFEVEEI